MILSVWQQSVRLEWPRRSTMLLNVILVWVALNHTHVIINQAHDILVPSFKEPTSKVLMCYAPQVMAVLTSPSPPCGGTTYPVRRPISSWRWVKLSRQATRDKTPPPPSRWLSLAVVWGRWPRSTASQSTGLTGTTSFRNHICRNCFKNCSRSDFKFLSPRVTYCTAHPSYPRVFCWIYRYCPTSSQI